MAGPPKAVRPSLRKEKKSLAMEGLSLKKKYLSLNSILQSFCF